MRNISPELQLRRSVLACLLWESRFYEDGFEIPAALPNSFPRNKLDEKVDSVDHQSLDTCRS